MSVKQVTMKFHRGTSAQWTSANPTLAQGEPAYETDTKRLKVGDGSTAYNSLDYVSGTGGGASYIIAASDSSASDKSQADVVCSGTDDQVDIQTAIDTLGTNTYGGLILLMPGKYMIESPLLFTSVNEGIELVGVASGGPYAYSSWLSTSTSNLDSYINVGNGTRHVKFKNIMLHSNSHTSGDGILVEGGDYLVMEDLQFNSIPDACIRFDTNQSQVNVINRLITIGNTSYTIYDNSQLTDSWILNSDIAATTAGIRLDSGNNHIINNNFYLSPYGLVLGTSGDQCTVSNNRFNHNTTIGFSTEGKNCSITGNRFEANEIGLNIGGGVAAVTGNTFLNSVATGINCIENGQVAINGNTFHGCWEGINIQGSNGTVINGNTFKINTTCINVDLFTDLYDTIVNSNVFNGTTGINITGANTWFRPTILGNNFSGVTNAITNIGSAASTNIANNVGYP